MSKVRYSFREWQCPRVAVFLRIALTAIVILIERLNTHDVCTRGKSHTAVTAYIFISLFKSLQLHVSAYKALIRLATIDARKQVAFISNSLAVPVKPKFYIYIFIAVLKLYEIIEIIKNKVSYEMHNLIQLTLLQIYRSLLCIKGIHKRMVRF
jgi:hypothetical protein